MLKQIVAAALAIAVSGLALADTQYDKPGFVTKLEKGRLWVFKEGSKELDQFNQAGEPTIAVSRIGEGPEGMTLKAPSAEVMDAYLAAPRK